MPYTLGNPNCPKCKGRGVVDVKDRVVINVSGKEIRYPQVERCKCLEVPLDEVAPVGPEAPASEESSSDRRDAQQRAAGDEA